jgi:hypothetical protein
MTYCKSDTNIDCTIIIAEMYCIEKISRWEKYSLQERDFNTELKCAFCKPKRGVLPFKNMKFANEKKGPS